MSLRMSDSEEDNLVEEIYNQLQNAPPTFIRVHQGGDFHRKKLERAYTEEKSSNYELNILEGIITSAEVELGEGVTVNEVTNGDIEVTVVEGTDIVHYEGEKTESSLLEQNIPADKNDSLLNDPDFLPDILETESDSDICAHSFESSPGIQLESVSVSQNGSRVSVDENVDQNSVGTHHSEQLSEETPTPKRRKHAKPEEWEINQTKRKRMSGQKYVGFQRTKTDDGKVVISRSLERSERKLGPTCDSVVCKNSKKRHCTEFKEEERKAIFDEFWSLTWKEKEVYVKSYISVTKPKTRKGKDPKSSRRSGSYFYNLRHLGVSRPVCKKLFLNTLGIKEWMAHNWVGYKKNQDRQDLQDNDNPTSCNSDGEDEARRRPRPYSKNSSEEKNMSEKKLFITEWLEKLPKLPAHYCRKDTSKLYLESVWHSKISVYEQYKKDCIHDEKPLASKTMFFELFDMKNLSIFTPRKDQCDMCCGFKAGNVSEEDYNFHRKEKERAREEKNNDKALAEAGKIYCLTADVEAVKVTPFTLASAMDYKTKLCNHNYTVYNLSSHQCTCYWFSEVEGDLTANAFSSCLIDYLKEKCTQPPLPIVIYTDGCTNQNRNQFLANALLHFSRQHNVTVIQKFLVKGHTQMEGDSVHAMIERKLKNKEVYILYELVKYTREAREKPFPYEAKYLYYDFFKDYSHINYYDSIRPGRKTGDPVVTDIHVLQYLPVGKIKYKLSFNDELKDLPRRAQTVEKNVEPVPLYKARLPIPEKKYKHLQDLKCVIPREYHNFYDELPYK